MTDEPATTGDGAAHASATAEVAPVVEGPDSIARGTAYSLVADVATVVSGLALSVIVARFLGPENRGVYVLAQIAGTMIAIVGDVGLSTSGLVFSANGRMSRRALHGTALLLGVTFTILGGLLLLGLEDWLVRTVLKGLDRTELWLVVAAIGPTLYSQVVGAMLTGMGTLRRLSFVRTGGAVAAPLVMLPAVWASGGSATWAIAAWLGASVLVAAGTALLAVRTMGVPVVPSLGQLRALLGFGLRAHVGTMSHQGFLRIDVLFISARSGPAPVGQYSLASVLAERISLVGSALYSAGAAHIGGGERVAAAALTARIVRVLILALVPVGIILALLATPLLPLVFGEPFRPAVTPFILLLPGTVCLTIWYVVSLYIVATLHRPGTTTIVQGGAMVLSLPLYWLAVRGWGMNGAAVVSSGIYALVMLAGIAIFRRESTGAGTHLVPRPRDIRELWAIVLDVIGRVRPATPHA